MTRLAVVGALAVALVLGWMAAGSQTSESPAFGGSEGATPAAPLAANRGPASWDPHGYVSISEWGLECGHNERMIDSYSTGMVQKVLMYRHCASSGSVRRKADTFLDGDGPCYSIPAGTARVLQVKFVFPRTVWRGADAC